MMDIIEEERWENIIYTRKSAYEFVCRKGYLLPWLSRFRIDNKEDLDLNACSLFILPHSFDQLINILRKLHDLISFNVTDIYAYIEGKYLRLSLIFTRRTASIKTRYWKYSTLKFQHMYTYMRTFYL